MNKRFELVILSREIPDGTPLPNTLQSIAKAPGWTLTRGGVLDIGLDEGHYKKAKEIILDTCVYDHKRVIGLKDLGKKVVKQLKKDGVKVRQPSKSKRAMEKVLREHRGS
jgi:hypothetical protein